MHEKLIFTAVLILFSSAAQAGMYVSAGIGLNLNDSKTTRNGIKNSYDNSAFYSGAVGYALPVLPLRAEIEGLYSKSNIKDAPGHMTVYGVLANAYARIPVWDFTPAQEPDTLPSKIKRPPSIRESPVWNTACSE